MEVTAVGTCPFPLPPSWVSRPAKWIRGGKGLGRVWGGGCGAASAKALSGARQDGTRLPFTLSFPPLQPSPSKFTGLFPDWHEFMGMLVTGPYFSLCVCVWVACKGLLNVHMLTDVKIINRRTCRQSSFELEYLCHEMILFSLFFFQTSLILTGLKFCLQ